MSSVRLLITILTSAALWIAFGSAPALSLALFVWILWVASSYVGRSLNVVIRGNRTLSADLIAPDTWVGIHLKLEADQAIGFRWAKVFDEINGECEIADSPSSTQVGYLGGFERKGYRVRFTRRGRYEIGPSKIEYGDLFGFAKNVTMDTGREYLDVHPRVIPMPVPLFPTNIPFGDRRAQNSGFEDISRTAGVREYRPRDPLNRIHWKASAQGCGLRVRLFESSMSPGICVCLDRRTEGFESQEGHDWAFSVAASLFVASAKESPTALRAGEQIGMDLGSSHIREGLRLLARCPVVQDNLASQLLLGPMALPWRSTILLVIGRTEPADIVALQYLRRRGHKLVVVVTRLEDRTTPVVSVADMIAVALNEQNLSDLKFIEIRR